MNIRVKRTMALVFLFAYFLLLGYWMLFGFGRKISSEYMYNVIPLQTINDFFHNPNYSLRTRVINIVGNIGVFVPFGILLPMILSNQRLIWLFIFEAGLLLLETIQFVTRRGSFDIDDFILNTIGALVGYLFIRKTINNKRR